MKLWAMLCRATWDKRVIVKSSDKTWSTGRRNANHSSILAVRISWSVWKGKKIWHPKMSLQRSEAVQYTTGEEWRAVTISSRNNGVAGPKWKWYSVVDVSGSENKVQCCKEQYCIGTWNVRSMNQGKLDVINQEMATVNINILRISELKWTGMGEFNSHDCYICYCGQESLRRNGVAPIVNKRPKCSTRVQSQKWWNYFVSFPSQTIQPNSSPTPLYNCAYFIC